MFTNTEKSIDLPKDEFVRLVQTIEISSDDASDYAIKTDGDEICDYFVDIRSALKNPIERDPFEKLGYVYHIEGNLYFHYNIDYGANNSCYVSYIPDISDTFEVVFCFGTVLFSEQGRSEKSDPSPTAEDLLADIENEEVFFILNKDLSFDVSSTIDNFGNLYYSEQHVEVTDERYMLVRKVVRNYPFIATIGSCGAIVTVIVCICFYTKKRTAIL